MLEKQEARRVCKHGRATYQRRYTGIIPHRDFERGCWALGALLAACMAFVFAWEVMGL